MAKAGKGVVDIAFISGNTSIKTASFRLRCINVIKRLNRNGFLAGLYTEGDVPKCIVLSKSYTKELVDKAITVRGRYGSKIYLDLCDNHFIDLRKNEQLKKVILMLDGVIVSTEILAKVVEENTGKKAIVIPDLVETYQYKTKNFFITTWNYLLRAWYMHRIDSNLSNNIIWFGNAKNSFNSGGMLDLIKIKKYLNKLPEDFTLTVVSNSYITYRKIREELSINTVYLPFNIYMMRDILLLNKTCILPVVKDNFSIAKTSNRVETAIFYGLNVWADSIPSYEKFDEWIHINNWEKFNPYSLQKVNGSNFVINDESVIKKWIGLIPN